jgi:organic radical activating enzyme
VVYDPRAEIRRMSVGQVWSDLQARGTEMLVVTGGEPLLQQDALVPLLELCKGSRWRIEVETAGTVRPAPVLVELVDQFNVSPKLANSHNPLMRRHRPEAIQSLAASGKSIWKFVVVGAADLIEIGILVDRHQLEPIYVMPEGQTADVVLGRSKDLVDAVLARGWNLTTRLQVLLYGGKRGY